jgi:hypothetical protein
MLLVKKGLAGGAEALRRRADRFANALEPEATRPTPLQMSMKRPHIRVVKVNKHKMTD